jgi:hypothetical protein
MQANQLPPLTEVEQARLETCIARRQMIAANQTALALMTKANDDEQAAIIAAAQARVPAPTGDAEVVELRPGGPAAA